MSNLLAQTDISEGNASLRVVFHIGLNKTGTSSLQKFLSLNPDNLAAQGWLYPQAGSDGVAHHEVFHAAHRGIGPLRELRDAIEAEAREAGGKNVLLSTEALHDTPHVGRIAEAFEGCEVQIIIFLRDYIDYLSSWYREDVQSSALCSDFENYAVLKRKPFVPILKRWEKAFGRDALHIRDYNRQVLRNGSSIDEILCGILGIDSIEGWNTVGWENNPSVSGNLLFFKRLMNNFIPRDEAPVYSEEIIELAKADDAFRRPMFIRKEFCEYLIGSQYTADLIQLEGEYGFSLSMKPPGRDGSLIPDLDRLKSDYELIQETCREKNLPFGERLAQFAPALCL